MATTTSEFVLSVKLKPLPTDGPDAYQTATGASIGTMLGAVPFLVKLWVLLNYYKNERIESTSERINNVR